MRILILSWICLLVAGFSHKAQAAKPVKVDGLFYEITGTNTARIVGSERNEATLVIPEKVTIKKATYTVTAVGNAFVAKSGKSGWGENLQKVVVPNTVVRLVDCVFAFQTLLREVQLPESLQVIGRSAFHGCRTLKEIHIPNGVRSIGINAFRECTALKEIHIPDGVQYIGNGAFSFSGIWKLDLSHTRIQTLDLNCLIGNMKYVALPSGITQFVKGNGVADSKTLYDMDYATLQALKDQCPNFVQNIHGIVLRNAEVVDLDFAPYLESLVLTGSIREVVHSNPTMLKHTSLKNVFMGGATIFAKTPYVIKVPSSTIEKIGDYAFQGASSLKIVDLPNTLKEIGDGAFNECSNLTSIILPNTVEKIGKWAFGENYDLQEVQLSNRLKEIGNNAFFHCSSLESITIPSSLNSMGECAFWGCSKLKEIKGLNRAIQYGYYEGKTDPFLNCPFDFEKAQKTFSYFALGYLKKELTAWEQKKEFETTAQWQQRVTVENREKRVDELIEQAKKEFVAQAEKPELNVTLGSYDADYNNFRLDAGKLGYVYVQVPAGEAPAFKANFNSARMTPTYGVKDDNLAIVGMEVRLNGKTYKNLDAVPDNNRELLAQLPPLNIDLDGESTPAQQGNATPTPQPKTADVDTNIPTTNTVADKTFAIVIANEKYTREARVPFALRDGEVFAEYCKKTLGIPERNIRVVKNATLNDMKFQLDWLRQVLATYNGKAKAIVYYAGHGIPDEADKGAYLLPVDGYGSNVATGFALKDFYATLNGAPAESVTVFLDACFSGAKRESGMMASARGVAIKVREEAPQGNMVVFTAAQGDETAYQYAEKGHGMFTYFLLKKLQDSKGNVTLGELGDYLVNEVKRESLLNNNKAQTPMVIPAPGITSWRERTLR